MRRGIRGDRRASVTAANPDQMAANALLGALGGSSSVVLMLDYKLGVTLNGATVSAWADQSGNGNHATQATSGNQPTYSSSVGMVFDGTDDYLTLGSVQFGATNISVGIQYEMNAVPVGGTQMLWQFRKDATPFWDTGMVVDFATYLDFSTSGKLGGFASLAGYNLALDTDPHRVIRTYNNGTATLASSYTIYTDGVSRTVAVDTGVDSAPATNIASIGAYVVSGPTVQRPFNGSIKRMIITNTVLSAGNAALVDTWLNRP